MERVLTINGLTYTAAYREPDVERIFEPLLKHWASAYCTVGKCFVVCMAAPPGTGKTTLAHFLAALGNELYSSVKFQALGMDGFHYPNDYLDTHIVVEDGCEKSLRARKGAPFTFDVEQLAEALRDLRSPAPRPWPDYSRELHDVVPEVLPITGNVLIVEGNYLLLDAPVWCELYALADETVFLSADADMLHTRLVGRKVAGGMDLAAAEAWYASSDGRNVEQVLAHHVSADIELVLAEDGSFSRVAS